MSERIFGKVKWFGSKGEAYGYIDGFKHEDGEDGQVFVHYKAILSDNQENPKFRTLVVGQKVEFEIGPAFPSDRNGTQALKVKVIL